MEKPTGEASCWACSWHRWLLQGWPNIRLGLACVLVTIGLLSAHSAYNRMLSPGSGGSFANAADSIYRLVVQGEARLGRYPASALRGSAPWLQIYDDHPGLAEKPQLERVREKQTILVDAVARSPLALFVGGLPEWNEYFFDFQFLPFPSIYDNDLAALFVAVLAALGLLRVCAPRGDRFRWFVLIANLGIFASVPFLIGGQTRVYAATIGYTGVLAALGAHVLTNWRAQLASSTGQGSAMVPAGLIMTLLAVVVVSSFVLGGKHPSQAMTAICAPGETRVTGILSPAVKVGAGVSTDFGKGAGLDALAAGAAGNRSMAPVAESLAVQKQLERSSGVVFVHYFADLSTRAGLMAVATASLDQTTGRPHTYCKIAADGIIRIRDAS